MFCLASHASHSDIECWHLPEAFCLAVVASIFSRGQNSTLYTPGAQGTGEASLLMFANILNDSFCSVLVSLSLGVSLSPCKGSGSNGSSAAYPDSTVPTVFPFPPLVLFHPMP